MENSPRGPYGKINIQYDDRDFEPPVSHTAEPIVTDANILKGDYSSILDNKEKLPEELRELVSDIISQEKVSYADKLFLEKVNKRILKSLSLKGKIFSLVEKIIGKENKEISLKSFGEDILKIIQGEGDLNEA